VYREWMEVWSVMIVVVINGKPTSGKDEFVKMCGELCDVVNISSVDKVNEAMRILGWDGIKDDKYRNMAAELKQLSIQYNEGPMKYILSVVHKVAEREANEIQWLKNRCLFYNIPCHTLLIRNGNVPEYNGNPADANVEQFNYDTIIDNTSTLTSLRVDAADFVNNTVWRV